MSEPRDPNDTSKCPHPRHLRCDPTDGRDEFCAGCGHTWVGSWSRYLARCNAEFGQGASRG